MYAFKIGQMEQVNVTEFRWSPTNGTKGADVSTFLWDRKEYSSQCEEKEMKPFKTHKICTLAQKTPKKDQINFKTLGPGFTSALYVSRGNRHLFTCLFKWHNTLPVKYRVLSVYLK